MIISQVTNAEVLQKYINKKEVVAIHSPYASYKSTTGKDVDSMDEKEASSEADKIFKIKAIKTATMCAVNQALEDGSLVVTSIDCYDACVSLAVCIMNKIKESGSYPTTMGHGLIFATESAMNKSGLKTFLEHEQISVVYVNPVDDKSYKSIEEEYQEYTKQFAKSKTQSNSPTEENNSGSSVQGFGAPQTQDTSNQEPQDQESQDQEPQLPIIKGSELTKRLSWHMIMSIATKVIFATTGAVRPVYNLRGQILRDALAKNIPANFIGISEEGKVEVNDVQEVLKNSKYVKKYNFYKDTDIVNIDINELTCALLQQPYVDNGNAFPQSLIAELPEDLFADDDKVTAMGPSVATDKVIAIYTSPIAFKHETPAEEADDESSEDKQGKVSKSKKGQITYTTLDVNADYGVGGEELWEYIMQIQETLSLLLRQGHTLLLPIDDTVGATVLRALYYAYAADPTLPVNTLVLQTSEITGVEQVQYQAFLNALYNDGKIRYVDVALKNRTVQVEAKSKRTLENGESTTETVLKSRTVKPELVRDLLVENMASVIAYYNMTSDCTISVKPTVCYDEDKAGNYERNEFEYVKDLGMGMFPSKLVAFSKNAWYKQIPPTVDVDKLVSLIWG